MDEKKTPDSLAENEETTEKTDVKLDSTAPASDAGEKKEGTNWDWQGEAPLADITEEEIVETVTAQVLGSDDGKEADADEKPEEAVEPDKDSETEDSETEKAEEADEVVEPKELTETSEEESLDDEEEDDGKEKCINCMKSLKEHEEYYCDTCKKSFSKKKFTIGQIVFVVVIALLCFGAYAVFGGSLAIASSLPAAQKQLDSGNYTGAMKQFEEIITEIDTMNTTADEKLSSLNNLIDYDTFFPYGEKVSTGYIRSCMPIISSNYISTFVNLVDTYMTEADLNKKRNSDIKEFYTLCQDLYSTQQTLANAVNQIVSESGAQSNEEIPLDKVIQKIDEIEKSADNKNQSMVDYYRFLSFYSLETEPEKQMEYLSKAYNAMTDYKQIYASSYAFVLYDKEEYDKAIEISNEILKINNKDEAGYYYLIQSYVGKKNFTKALEACELMNTNAPDDLNYYSYKAHVYRLDGKLDKALEIAKIGEVKSKELGTQSEEIFRQRAIAEILLDKKEDALKSIKSGYDIAEANAMSTGSYNTEFTATYLIICFAAKDMESYNAELETLTEQGYKLSDISANLAEFVEGKTTLEKIFMEGKGDVS